MSNPMHPLTRRVWLTLQVFGPIASDELRAMLPEMTKDEVTRRLSALQARGYASSEQIPGRRQFVWRLVLDPASTAPRHSRRERLLGERAEAREEARRAAAAQAERARLAAEHRANAPVVPPSDRSIMEGIYEPKPAPVRPGSMDFLRVPSLQFGRRMYRDGGSAEGQA